MEDLSHALMSERQWRAEIIKFMHELRKVMRCARVASCALRTHRAARQHANAALRATFGPRPYIMQHDNMQIPRYARASAPHAQVVEVPDLQARSAYLKIQMEYERAVARLARTDATLRSGRTPTRTAQPAGGEGLDLLQLQVRAHAGAHTRTCAVALVRRQWMRSELVGCTGRLGIGRFRCRSVGPQDDMRTMVSELKQRVAGTPVSSLELEAFIRDVGKVSDVDTLQAKLHPLLLPLLLPLPLPLPLPCTCACLAGWRGVGGPRRGLPRRSSNGECLFVLCVRRCSYCWS
jgi:hypothetical protein